MPILICDHQKKIIAAIHAGWKGAYKGIVDKVIKFMIKKGSKPQNISSSKIRRFIKQRFVIKKYVAPSIEKYIKENNLNS